MKEAIKFVDVIRSVSSLGEERIYNESARSTLHDDFFLGSDGRGIVGAEVHVEVQDSMFVFVTKKRKQVKGRVGL